MPRRPRRRLDARPRSVPSHIDLAALDSTRSTITSEPPLLLLPLRLEYRIVKPHSRPEIVDLSATINALRELDRGAGGSTPRHRRARDAAAALVRSAAMSAPLIVRPAVSIGAVQIWFRWYPDDGFARKGIEPASDAELRSLEAFRARVSTRPVFDLQDPETAAAWTELAAGLGADRALHLVRQVSSSGGARSPEAIGAIAALPHAVSLFALKGETIELLGTGGPIPPNSASERSVVSYTPEALEPGGWLRDFPVAEERGMAMKLTEPAAVARALDADFIVAVGRSGADGHAEMEALVRDGIANGTFGIVRQDTPTNNNSGARTTTADPLRDLQRFLDEAAMDERGAVPGNGSAAADVLADALGIDRGALRKARHAGDTPAADARAMLRVTGPALLDGALDGVTAVAGVDENTFVEILAGVASARGQVPVVRFGQNPYGVLPISPIADLDTSDGDAKTARVYEFLAQYSRIVRALLPVQADRSVVVLEPNDPHAAAKLEGMLKSNRVSTRIVVGNEAETSTASLGCRYVIGPRPEGQPAAYLDRKSVV